MRPTASLLLGCAVLVGMPGIARAQVVGGVSDRGILSAAELGPKQVALAGRAVAEGGVRAAAAGRGTRLGDEWRAIKKGALIGLAVGAVAFPVYEGVRQEKVCGPIRGTIHACDDERRVSTIVLLCGSAGAAAGAAIGAIVGAAVASRKSTSPGARVRPTLVVGPFVGRSRTGLAVSIAF